MHSQGESCLFFLSCLNEILIEKAGKQYQTVITEALLTKFGNTLYKVPYLFTYKAQHFFTRKYACLMKICLKLEVRLITEYFP